MTYIRETIRKFMTRIKEHESSKKLEDDKSLLEKHSNERKHNNQDLIEEYKILTIESKKRKRKL